MPKEESARAEIAATEVDDELSLQPYFQVNRIPETTSVVESANLAMQSDKEAVLAKLFFATDLMGEARMLDETITKIIKSSREPTISESEEKVLALLPELTKTAQQISEWSALIRAIQLDPNMSASDKRKNIDSLLAARNALFEQFITTLPKDFAKEHGMLE